VSGDLRLHPVGIFLESVLAHLDRTRIDLRVYVTTDEEDAITAKLKPHASGWRSIAALPEAAARMIHDDGIDVLVDLAGHTQSSGLAAFGWKPSPVQASWLGFFATTGCDAIDYFIGDRYTLPDADAHHFVEAPWRLPDSFLVLHAAGRRGRGRSAADGGARPSDLRLLRPAREDRRRRRARVVAHPARGAGRAAAAQGARARPRGRARCDRRALRAAWHRRRPADPRGRFAAHGIPERI
jgi:hypothetical protein